MSGHFRVIILLVAFGYSAYAYQCSSDEPTTGVDKCDHGVCDTCAQSCSGSALGWDATCKIQGGIVTETCTCRKSNPYYCDSEHPTTGVEKCDPICEQCDTSCKGFLGWDAVCDIQGGIVTETCKCRKNLKFMANVLSKIPQEKKL